jgi:hypothetical protein
VVLVAGATIDRTIVAGQKRYECNPLAIGALRLIELTRLAGTLALARCPAVWAAPRLVGKALLLVESLLTSRKNEWSIALPAHKCPVRKGHVETLLGSN